MCDCSICVPASAWGLISDSLPPSCLILYPKASLPRLVLRLRQKGPHLEKLHHENNSPSMLPGSRTRHPWAGEGGCQQCGLSQKNSGASLYCHVSSITSSLIDKESHLGLRRKITWVEGGICPTLLPNKGPFCLSPYSLQFSFQGPVRLFYPGHLVLFRGEGNFVYMSYLL